jgi:hypothetical protein
LIGCAGNAISSDRDYFRPESLNTAVLKAVQHAVTIAADDSQIFESRYGHLSQSVQRPSMMDLDEPFTDPPVETCEVEATDFTGKTSDVPLHAFLFASRQFRTAFNFPVQDQLLSAFLHLLWKFAGDVGLFGCLGYAAGSLNKLLPLLIGDAKSAGALSARN